MVVRVIKKNPSILWDGIDSHRTNCTQFMEHYLCMVKSLSRSKVNFLCLLEKHLSNKFSGIEKDGIYWLPKTFDEWASELGLCDRSVNRIITSLRQNNIILTQRLSFHKTIRTNYYTINYAKLWEMIPESRSLFSPPHSGEAA